MTSQFDKSLSTTHYSLQCKEKTGIVIVVQKYGNKKGTMMKNEVSRQLNCCMRNTVNIQLA